MAAEDYRYPGQANEEITKRVVYKHIMSIVPFLFAIIVVAVVVIVGSSYLGANPSVIPVGLPTGLLGIIGFVAFSVLVFLFVAVIWIWRANVVVITNQHLVDIDQIGLFNKKVSTLNLSRIQDVSARVNGPLQTILGYGHIDVQTAGEDKNFLFDYVPNPYELEHYILQAHREFMEEHGGDPDGISDIRDSKAGSGSGNPQTK